MKNDGQDIKQTVDELVSTMSLLSNSMSEQTQDHIKMMKMTQMNEEIMNQTVATMTNIASEIAQLKIQFKVVDLKLLEICRKLDIRYESFERYEENIN